MKYIIGIINIIIGLGTCWVLISPEAVANSANQPVVQGSTATILLVLLGSLTIAGGLFAGGLLLFFSRVYDHILATILLILQIPVLMIEGFEYHAQLFYLQRRTNGCA